MTKSGAMTACARFLRAGWLPLTANDGEHRCTACHGWGTGSVGSVGSVGSIGSVESREDKADLSQMVWNRDHRA